MVATRTPALLQPGKSFRLKRYGKGFTFDDSGPADEETPGIPSPFHDGAADSREPKKSEVIFPYIGAREVNTSPTHFIIGM